MAVNLNPMWFISGYKTYIVGIMAVVVGAYKGDINLVMYGLGLITMRQAIAKME